MYGNVRFTWPARYERPISPISAWEHIRFLLFVFLVVSLCGLTSLISDATAECLTCVSRGLRGTNPCCAPGRLEDGIFGCCFFLRKLFQDKSTFYCGKVANANFTSRCCLFALCPFVWPGWDKGHVPQDEKSELSRMKMISKKVSVHRKTHTRMKNRRTIRMMMILMTRVDALATGLGRRGRYCGSGIDALTRGWGRSGRYCGSGMDAMTREWGRSGSYCDSGMDALAAGWGRSGLFRA